MFDYLTLNPAAGDVMPGTGGARKLRWSAGGKDKRGGARVIYYYASTRAVIYLLMGYRKSDQPDLTHQARKRLKDALDRIKRTE